MTQCHLLAILSASACGLFVTVAGKNVTELGVVHTAAASKVTSPTLTVAGIPVAAANRSAALASPPGQSALGPASHSGDGSTMRVTVVQTPQASSAGARNAAVGAAPPGAAAVPGPQGVDHAASPLRDVAGKIAVAPIKGQVAAYLRHQEFSAHTVEISRVIKIIALISNVLLQLSPLRTVREIRQAASTLEYDALPLFTLFFGSLQWFLYALLGLTLTGNKAMVDVLHAYVGGVALGAFYMYSFYQNCRDGEKSRGVMAMFRGGGIIIVFELFSVLLLPSRISMRILGSMCAFFSIMVGASPLVAIEEIFRTQSVAVMQTDMVIVCFCGSCAWATMGFLMNDMCIAIPNTFSIVIGGIQVHLILKFAETGLWKNHANDGANAPLKGNNVGYEASVYMHLKVFFLVSIAHARFVLTNYANFATTTLGETYAYIVELQSMPRTRGCSLKRCVAASRGRDSGESLDLL